MEARDGVKSVHVLWNAWGRDGKGTNSVKINEWTEDNHAHSANRASSRETNERQGSVSRKNEGQRREKADNAEKETHEETGRYMSRRDMVGIRGDNHGNDETAVDCLAIVVSCYNPWTNGE